MPVYGFASAGQLADALRDAGWSDVVCGGGYVTIPLGLGRTDRFGFKLEHYVDSSRATPIFCSAHSEGSAPSNVVNAYIAIGGGGSSYGNIYGNCVLYTYPEEVIALASLYSGSYNLVFVIAKTYDPDTGSHIGWIGWSVEGRYTYTFGVTSNTISAYSLYSTPKILGTKFAVTRMITDIGVAKGVIYDDGFLLPSLRIGDETFVRLRGGILVKI